MTLRNRITVLAEEFSAGVIAAIRAASLEEILSESGGSGGSNGAARRAPALSLPTAAAVGDEPARRGPGRPRGRKSGRLARRSPDQIALVVDSVVGALKKSKSGMRSEQLQKVLGLDKKEITGPLAEALSARKISKKGERRATTYFAK